MIVDVEAVTVIDELGLQSSFPTQYAYSNRIQNVV
jgi:hypothetical protein